MSYYGTTALDAYTGALTGYGGSSRYESILDRKPYGSTTYSSDYSLNGSSSGGRGNKNSDLSAYEKYCRGDYLSELTGLRTSSYTAPYRPPDTSYVDDILSDSYCTSKNRSTTPIPSSSSSSHLSSRRKYAYEPDSVDILSNKFGSQSIYKTSGGYSADSNGSSSYFNDNDTIRYSSKRSSSRPGAIGSAPAFDRYGKELSNYERWKISQGSTLDDEYNNNKKNSRRNNDAGHSNINNNPSNYENKLTSNDGYREIKITQDGTLTERDLRDTGKDNSIRAKSTKCDDTDGSIRSGSRLHKEREFSVIPTSNSSFLDTNDQKAPAITGSRFSGRTSSMATNNRTISDPFTTSSSRKSPPSSSYVPTVANNSSSSYKTRPTHSFPSDVRSKLVGYDVRDVIGDGGCYYRCLSVYFSGSEENYNTYRREVMSYIKQNLENYSSMIKSEVGYASTNDYFSRKTRFDRQEFAETTEIIATCCLYNINVHVLALVPGGRRSWEWLHFDPSIGSGKPSTASRDVYLYNQGSVHFMLCTPK